MTGRVILLSVRGREPTRLGLYDGRGQIAYLPPPGDSDARWTRHALLDRARVGRFLFARRVYPMGP